ncbi:MAG: DUF1211 domain-containing protein [Proteobacteria bacterium]|nr:DUF1211 domain-containing protein [Pseudomonadota bacterium]
MPRYLPYNAPSKERMAALVDGIFAVAMTLLVIDLKLPDGLRLDSDRALLDYFSEASGSFTAYVLSFLVTALLWIGHNYQFRYLERLDRRLLWINILFLLLITLVPFGTNLIASHPHLPVAAGIYAAMMALLNIALLAHARAMGASPELHSKEWTPLLARQVQRRLAVICTIPLAALAVAPFSSVWSVRLFYALAALHFAPHRHKAAT